MISRGKGKILLTCTEMVASSCLERMFHKHEEVRFRDSPSVCFCASGRWWSPPLRHLLLYCPKNRVFTYVEFVALNLGLFLSGRVCLIYFYSRFGILCLLMLIESVLYFSRLFRIPVVFRILFSVYPETYAFLKVIQVLSFWICCISLIVQNWGFAWLPPSITSLIFSYHIVYSWFQSICQLFEKDLVCGF